MVVVLPFVWKASVLPVSHLGQPKSVMGRKCGVEVDSSIQGMYYTKQKQQVNGKRVRRSKKNLRTSVILRTSFSTNMNRERGQAIGGQQVSLSSLSLRNVSR